MNKWIQEHFALTEKGAGELRKACFSSFVVYIVNMFPAILTMIFLEELLSGRARSNMFYLVFSVLVSVVLYFVIDWDYDLLYTATYRESANLRIEIGDILSRLPLSYFSKHDLSDLAQTVMNDVERIEHAMSHAMSKTVGFALFFPLVSVMLLIGHWRLALCVLIPIILSFVLVWVSKKLQIYGATKFFHQLRENSEAFQETIELQQEIKSFGMAESVKERLYRQMEETEKIHLRTELYHAIPVLLSGMITQVAFGIVAVFGTYWYLNGELSITYFLGYLLVSMKLKEGIDALSANMGELFYLDARIKRIKELRETPTQEGRDREISSYDIELERVSFSYDGERKVLKDVSFTAKQNEVTALVGVSGCGKTSVLRLISRLYDHDGGAIRIGGADVKETSTASLFEKVSIVFQDVTLFNASVTENIRIGRPTATEGEVRHAAKLANCEEFIDKLPEGYQTLIGENGAMLSGGERQRLSIARAILKNAPIIILDEISASLDVENEQKIQESLNKLIADKTVVIISHRLKSVEKADKIVVIDDGKVEAAGRHEELLKSSKIYQNLVQKANLAENFKY